MKKASTIRIDGEVAFISLSNGRAEAAIDIADIPLVEGRNWFAICPNRVTYAVASGVQTAGRRSAPLLMHRVIFGTCCARNIDHIDGDGLNNRRANLRPATHSENQHNRRPPINNRSGVKGVHFQNGRGTWRAEITKHGRLHYLGSYRTKEEAAAAYAEASVRLNGEFARLS